MKHRIAIFIFISCSLAAFGQADSLKTKRKFYRANDARLSLGIERSVFVDAGYAYSLEHIHNPAFIVFYASAQLNKTTNDSNIDVIFGPKVGVEATFEALIGGIEMRYMTTGYESQWYVTPRVGLTAMGVLSLTYGRNFTNGSQFKNEISKNQLALILRISWL